MAMAAQPCRASSRAVAAPIPRLPPVTMAILPANGAGMVEVIVREEVLLDCVSYESD